MPTPSGFPLSPLNMFAVFKGLTDQNIGFFSGNGAPVNGAAGSFVGSANPGSMYVDTATGQWYVNFGTAAAPVWVADTTPVQGLGGLGVTGNAKMTYDFAVDGGAISTITPSNSPTLPAGAIILGGTIDITTQLTSGGAATIALGLGAGAQVAALKAATAVATWVVGQLAMIPVFTAATYVKVAAATPLTVTIAAQALTAGKFDVNVVYVQGNV